MGDTRPVAKIQQDNGNYGQIAIKTSDLDTEFPEGKLVTIASRNMHYFFEKDHFNPILFKTDSNYPVIGVSMTADGIRYYMLPWLERSYNWGRMIIVERLAYNFWQPGSQENLDGGYSSTNSFEITRKQLNIGVIYAWKFNKYLVCGLVDDIRVTRVFKLKDLVAAGRNKASSILDIPDHIKHNGVDFKLFFKDEVKIGDNFVVCRMKWTEVPETQAQFMEHFAVFQIATPNSPPMIIEHDHDEYPSSWQLLEFDCLCVNAPGASGESIIYDLRGEIAPRSFLRPFTGSVLDMVDRDNVIYSQRIGNWTHSSYKEGMPKMESTFIHKLNLFSNNPTPQVRIPCPLHNFYPQHLVSAPYEREFRELIDKMIRSALNGILVANLHRMIVEYAY